MTTFVDKDGTIYEEESHESQLPPKQQKEILDATKRIKKRYRDMQNPNLTMSERNKLDREQREETKRINRIYKNENERLQIEKDRLAYEKANYYREGERIDKINKRSDDKKKKRQRENEERVRFARNYFARDYVQNITNWTAAKERPKGYEYTRSGLRMEAVSKGFTDPQSGLLAVDTATQQRKGSLVTSKGSLRIGTGSLISGFNAGVANMKLPINNVTLGLRFGKGDVIMPSQVLKFKKRKI
jgi:hypothetical protein